MTIKTFFSIVAPSKVLSPLVTMLQSSFDLRMPPETFIFEIFFYVLSEVSPVNQLRLFSLEFPGFPPTLHISLSVGWTRGSELVCEWEHVSV